MAITLSLYVKSSHARLVEERDEESIDIGIGTQGNQIESHTTHHIDNNLSSNS